MGASKFLIILAVVLFAVALVLVVVGGGTKDLVEELTLGGLTSFAAAHAV